MTKHEGKDKKDQPPPQKPAPDNPPLEPQDGESDPGVPTGPGKNP